MAEAILGLKNRVPVPVVATAIEQFLSSGELDMQYMTEQLQLEINGDLRLKKAKSQLSSYFLENPVLQVLIDNKEAVLLAMRIPADRNLIALALMCGKYEYAYDTVSIMGRLFHVEDAISTTTITNRLGQKYGHNKNMDNTFYMIIPSIYEAGLCARPRAGVFEVVDPIVVRPVTKKIWAEAFYTHNPLYPRNEEDGLRYEPFMKFIAFD